MNISKAPALHALIANDAYAMTFQSLPQYRTALLNSLIANQAAPTVPVAWRDALRRSGAEDYHGRIAFLPAQLDHFVSMLTAHQPAQEQTKLTTVELVHALQQAERLLRAAGFAMTGTASSQIVAAIAEHATAAQQEPVAAPQQAAAPCKHAKCTAYYAHIECLDCGRVKTDSGWGIASNQWFKSEEDAKFYRFNGRLPQVESAAQLDGGQGEDA